jgi:RimJ/RimL family protein N-acetyltransferase
MVRLEPLSIGHVPALCDVALDPDLWRWTGTLIRGVEDMRTYVETALGEAAHGAALPFAIVASSVGRAVGSTRYGNIALEHRRLEIGWTWLGRAWQRTPLNTECKYLLLRHAFEVLDCLRVEFKTDALNSRSRAALQRIGAVEEGTLRQHMIAPSGRLRDTVYYSILNGEWPEVKRRLELKLAQPFAHQPSSRATS